MPWQDVVRLVNAGLPSWKKSWTVDRLKRAAKRYVDEGLLEADVLKRSPTRPVDDRLLAIVVAIATGRPDMTLQQIADQLEAMRERTPRGRTKWQPSSVKMLLDRAREPGTS